MDGMIDSIKTLFSSTPPPPKPAPSSEPSKPSRGIETKPEPSSEDLGQQAYKEAALERAKRARQHVLEQSSTPLPSPGRMDDIARESTDVLQVPTYDGFRVEYHKPVCHTADKSLTYSHLLWLGPSHLQGGSSYEFATQLQLGNVTLMSQLDTNGILNGRYHHQWTPQLLSKVQFAIAPAQKSQLNMTMGEMDYLGGDYSVNLKFSHDGIIVGSYLQSVTPTISTGVECLLQANELTAHGRFVARYDSKVSGDSFNASILDQGTTQLAYVRRVSPRLTLASEFKFDPNNRESTAKVGYKWNLRQSQFRGAIDSNGMVSAALDEAITPVMRFSVNGEIDHFQQQYKFGMGISVG